MKKIFIHIGGHKTGSTAIQEHLKFNKVYMANNGFAYFDTYESNNFLKFINEKNLKKKTIRFNFFIKELDSINNDIIILSRGSLSGNIENGYNDAKIFANYIKKLKKKGYQVKIIYFVRDPIPFIVSTFFQLKKNKKFTNLTFKKYIQNQKPELFFYKTITSYKKYFDKNLIINNYSKIYKNQNQFINSFAGIISKNLILKKINKTINKSYTHELQFIVNKLDEVLNKYEKKKVNTILNVVHKISYLFKLNSETKKNTILVHKKQIDILKKLQNNYLFLKMNKNFNLKLKLNYKIKPLLVDLKISFFFLICLIINNKISSAKLSNKKIIRLVKLLMNNNVLKKFLIFII